MVATDSADGLLGAETGPVTGKRRTRDRLRDRARWVGVVVPVGVRVLLWERVRLWDRARLLDRPLPLFV